MYSGTMSTNRNNQHHTQGTTQDPDPSRSVKAIKFRTAKIIRSQPRLQIARLWTVHAFMFSEQNFVYKISLLLCIVRCVSVPDNIHDNSLLQNMLNTRQTKQAPESSFFKSNQAQDTIMP
jgi:hypothetical protein